MTSRERYEGICHELRYIFRYGTVSGKNRGERGFLQLHTDPKGKGVYFWLNHRERYIAIVDPDCVRVRTKSVYKPLFKEFAKTHKRPIVLAKEIKHLRPRNGMKPNQRPNWDTVPLYKKQQHLMPQEAVGVYERYLRKLREGQPLTRGEVHEFTDLNSALEASGQVSGDVFYQFSAIDQDNFVGIQFANRNREDRQFIRNREYIMSSSGDYAFVPEAPVEPVEPDDSEPTAPEERLIFGETANYSRGLGLGIDF